ncbi:MAG: flagellar basal body-associated FliL family protein [Actinomycetes bacterium]
MAVKQASPPIPADTTEPAPKPRRSKKKLVLIMLIVLVLVGGAGGYRVLGKNSSHPPATPAPGTVEALSSISINLAGGHYLKVGLALQLTSTVKTPPDGSQALNAAISLFTNQSMTDLLNGAFREQMRRRLLATIETEYPHEVMDLYLTEFVMQ